MSKIFSSYSESKKYSLEKKSDMFYTLCQKITDYNGIKHFAGNFLRWLAQVWKI